MKKRLKRIFRREKETYSLPNVWGENGFLLCREQVKDQGEDFGILARKEGRLMLGVFDGCGGSGARVYPGFDGHTGAYVASRAAVQAAGEWFYAGKAESELKSVIDHKLEACRKRSGAGPALLGSLNKEFPTTMAMILAEAKSPEAVFYWCGDSRGYALDEDGLHQVTVDDVTVTDPMKNLREDAPLTNVLSASQPYRIHRQALKLQKPAVLFTATDGCFGYLPTPMEFEKILLKTLQKSRSMKEWREWLSRALGEVAGDDFTLCLWQLRFRDFRELKEALKPRLAYLEQAYPLKEGNDEAELFSQWEKYRKGYEVFQDPQSGFLREKVKESEAGKTENGY